MPFDKLILVLDSTSLRSKRVQHLDSSELEHQPIKENLIRNYSWKLFGVQKCLGWFLCFEMRISRSEIPNFLLVQGTRPVHSLRSHVEVVWDTRPFVDSVKPSVSHTTLRKGMYRFLCAMS